MKRILCIVILVAGGAACGESSGPYEVSSPEAPAPGEPAPPTPAPDVSSGALRTAADRFVLERGDIGWEATIPFTYRNPTAGPVFVLVCLRPHPPGLEKWVEGRWVPAWSAVVPMCLAPPLRIEAGASHSGSLWLFAGYPSSNFYPKFEMDDPEGTYRLVWWPRVSYDGPGYGPLLPVQQRVSNPFELIEGD